LDAEKIKILNKSEYKDLENKKINKIHEIQDTKPNTFLCQPFSMMFSPLQTVPKSAPGS
jgi:hypothetical protein